MKDYTINEEQLKLLFYKTSLNPTVADLCEALGIPRRTADNWIIEIKEGKAK